MAPWTWEPAGHAGAGPGHDQMGNQARRPWPQLAGVTPVVEGEQHQGQRDAAGFAQQRQRQADERRSAALADVEQRAGGIEDERERVLGLTDPGQAGHVDGMNGKEEGGPPCAAQSQRQQALPQQQRAHQVQPQTDDVIAEGGVAKQMVLDPEQRPRQRQIVGLLAGRPQLEQAVRVAHARVAEDVELVVEQITRADGRPRAQCNAHTEKQSGRKRRQQKSPPPRGAGARARRGGL